MSVCMLFMHVPISCVISIKLYTHVAYLTNRSRPTFQCLDPPLPGSDRQIDKIEDVYNVLQKPRQS